VYVDHQCSLIPDVFLVEGVFVNCVSWLLPQSSDFLEMLKSFVPWLPVTCAKISAQPIVKQRQRSFWLHYDFAVCTFPFRFHRNFFSEEIFVYVFGNHLVE